ncbi:MAG: FG-GAP-like repeat-containing protein, partial [Rubricoccaceae bacterium]|nr:FG-GAP-like repeat-containing protein [Rubricoccaceae bacterium]
KEGDPRPLEEQLYGRRSGSSLSAPQVSGAAALLRSIEPSLSPESIRGILTATARDVRDPGWDHYTAAGLLDVANALGLPYPTNVSIITPEQDDGTAESTMDITGSAIAPLFSSWRVEYATFDETSSTPIGTWNTITAPVETQIRESLLGTWQTGTIAEGTYLVRLVVELTTGQTLEDRRRVTIDRTPPSLEVSFAGPAYFDGRQGVLLEVESDDLTLSGLTVSQGAVNLTPTIFGQEREQRHGLFWPNDSYTTGPVTASVSVENASGLTAESDTVIELDPLPLNSSLFTETVLDVPSGYLMERTPDFDLDGLAEIVFNRLVEGEPSDSVFIYEWAGEEGFLFERQLIASLIPRDEGDSDDDGRRELLFQFGANTFLAEANARQADCPSLGNTDPCYPDEIVFDDQTPPSSTRRPLWGARLSDLDEDGAGEIIGHDLRLRTPEGEVPEIMWRIFEWNGTTYQQVAELENPTNNSDPEEQANSFSDPRGLIGDFDGDGRLEWLAGDNDGDFMLWEATGNNQYSSIWSHETDRYNAGGRLVQGDFDGDGVEEFWGMTTPKTAAGIEGAAFGLAHQFDSDGDNSFMLLNEIAFQSLATRYGTMASADFDGDGIDELIVVHSPDLWILSSQHDWKPVFHTGAIEGFNGPSGLRSVRAVASDFTGDAVPELLVSGADGRMRLFSYNPSAASLPPPLWASTYAIDASSVHLEWTTEADSVTVYTAEPGGTFNPLLTTEESTVDIVESDEMIYALRAWFGSSMSDLGPHRQIRPHEPASVVEVRYPGGSRIGLVFSEVLEPTLSADQFTLNGESAGISILLQNGGRSALVEFSHLPLGAGMISWSGVRDAEGTPVGQTSVAIHVPAESEDGTLLLSSWEILNGEQVRLVFNEPLTGVTATNLSNYRVEPVGAVSAVEHSQQDGREVVLTVSGRALGATGLQTTIVTRDLLSTTGSELAPEGNVATLSAFAEDLADVFVFPNPYRSTEHSGRVVIAGLPREATIEIYSVGGEHVRSLEEFDGDGGAPWDLTDENGELVSSGVYIIRVETEGADPVIEKVAIIR